MQKPILLYPFRVIVFVFSLLVFSINLGFAQNKKPATAGRRSYFTFGYGQAVYGSNFGESSLLRFGYEQRFADNFGIEAYTHIIRYQTSRENFTNYDLRLRLLYHFEKRFQPQIIVEPVSNIRHHKSKLPSQRLSEGSFQTIGRSKFDPYFGFSVGGTANRTINRSSNFLAGAIGVLAGLRFIPHEKWGVFIESTASFNGFNSNIYSDQTTTLQAGTVFQF
jgi:hypothetical protein